MTVADWIRSMTDLELAAFLYEILHQRDLIITEKLAEQGVQHTLVEVPAISIAKHLKFLKSPAEDIK